MDIGVFVHNGVHWSPPAFVCFYYLDDEARTYDADGRTLEVFYGYGPSTIGHPRSPLLARDKNYDITDWPALLALVVGGASLPREGAVGGASLPRELFAKHFKPEELAALGQAAKDLDAALAKADEPTKKHDEAVAARAKFNAPIDAAKKKVDEAKKAVAKEATDAAKKAISDAEAELKGLQEKQKQADAEVRAAKEKLDAALQPTAAILTGGRSGLGGSVKARLEAALNAIKDDPTLYVTHAKAINALADGLKDAAAKKAFLAARDEAVKLGILKPEGDGFALCGSTGVSPVARLTRFERSKLEWLNIAALQHVLCPGTLNRRYSRNFVNNHLSTMKSWRDVYRYDDKGRLIGWTRHEGVEPKDFTADGALVLERDDQGRPLEARTVAYVAEGNPGRRVLKQKPGDAIRHYAYDGPQDRLGRIAKTEKAPQ